MTFDLCEQMLVSNPLPNIYYLIYLINKYQKQIKNQKTWLVTTVKCEIGNQVHMFSKFLIYFNKKKKNLVASTDVCNTK